MPPSTTFDEPPEFDVGDRVVTVDPVGPRLHRIPRGSAGVVVARTPEERLIAVRFDTGRMEHVNPARLQFERAEG
ncbi:hypothetical protein GCM10010531_15480 [Blastococcus jejuensis]|uniref:5'-3' exoribonuclease 1 SH3-like domain-containing protein n=1 Tax=Blastococcus jejuensis TaxID=351224 RepID=A0ABP6P0T2_9ACTN